MEVMKNNSKKLYNGTESAIERRKRAIKALENQLKRGTKILSNSKHKELGGSAIIGLDNADIVRINKELTVLRNRV